MSCMIGERKNNWHSRFYLWVFHYSRLVDSIGFMVWLYFQIYLNVYMVVGMVNEKMFDIVHMEIMVTLVCKVVRLSASAWLLLLNVVLRGWHDLHGYFIVFGGWLWRLFGYIWLHYAWTTWCFHINRVCLPHFSFLGMQLLIWLPVSIYIL